MTNQPHHCTDADHCRLLTTDPTLGSPHPRNPQEPS
jgi:hypothetical protein